MKIGLDRSRRGSYYPTKHGMIKLTGYYHHESGSCYYWQAIDKNKTTLWVKNNIKPKEKTYEKTIMS